MVGLGVGDEHIVQPPPPRRQLREQHRHVGVPELLVAGVHQRGLVLPEDEEGVVGGAVLEAKLDVEAVAVPVEGADGERVGRDGRDLRSAVSKLSVC